ncbi:MAG: hypothetical protein AAB840_02415 [Patescibacteria group bacterium]
MKITLAPPSGGAFCLTNFGDGVDLGVEKEGGEKMIHVTVRHGDIPEDKLLELQSSLPYLVANYLLVSYYEKASDYVELEFVRRGLMDVSRFRFTISIFVPISLSGDAKVDTNTLSESARKIAKGIHENSAGGERDFAVSIYPFECLGYFFA